MPGNRRVCPDFAKRRPAMMMRFRHPGLGRVGAVCASARKQALLPAAALLLFFSLAGCAALMQSAVSDLAQDLSAAVLNSEDPQLVSDGAPAYLLLMDGFVRKDAQSPDLLLSAANLNAFYARVFLADEKRSDAMTQKALAYAQKGACKANPVLCGLRRAPYREIEATLAKTKKADVPALFSLGIAWAGYIQAHSSDMAAIADLASVEALFARTAALDETYMDGSAHLYLGILATLAPPALGGRPEVGKAHFLKAIELSHGKNLSVKVAYARQYARVLFNRELHDRLLNEVLAADPHAEGYTLFNVIAQKEAAALLADANDYF